MKGDRWGWCKEHGDKMGMAVCMRCSMDYVCGYVDMLAHVYCHSHKPYNVGKTFLIPLPVVGTLTSTYEYNCCRLVDMEDVCMCKLLHSDTVLRGRNGLDNEPSFRTHCVVIWSSLAGECVYTYTLIHPCFWATV
jgi:hypothetical protein